MEVSLSCLGVDLLLVKRGGYQYKENCYEIFDKFFMESNPFFDLCTDLSDVKGTPLEIEGSMFGSAFGGMNQPLAEPMEDVCVDVDCTLIEFYNGARKQVEYERQVIGLDGTTLR
jgi:DnaJ-class molecular chaperone